MKKYLQTERTYLQEFESGDEAKLFELDSDPGVMTYINGGKPTPKHKIKKMMLLIQNCTKNYEGRYGVWMAFEKSRSSYLGWFHLFPSPEKPNDTAHLYLGYRLHQKYWGRGFATEVSKALIRKAFVELEATEVLAQAMVGNSASQKVMTKCGLQFREHYVDSRLPLGMQQAVLYSIKNPN